MQQKTLVMNGFARFIYRTLAGKNPVEFTRMITADDLTARVYSERTLGSHRLPIARIEGWVKTALLFSDALGMILGVLKEVPEKDWDSIDTNPEVYRSAWYQYAEAIEGVANNASRIIALPAMMDFWRNELKQAPEQIKLSLEKLISQRARTAGNWLLNNRMLTRLGSAADRLCVLATAISFAQSLSDTANSLSKGDEGDTLLHAAEGINAAMILGGFIASSEFLLGANAVPGIGNALFIAGTIVSLAMAGGQIYWQYWGRRQWYSNTYVIFDDRLEQFTARNHTLEYRDEAYGQNPTLARLFHRLERGYSKTLVDFAEVIAYQQLNQPIDTYNVAVELINATIRLFHLNIDATDRLKRLETNGNVAWQELSWCGLPQLMMSERPLLDDQLTKFLDCINLTRAELDWLYRWKHALSLTEGILYDLETMQAELKPALRDIMQSFYIAAHANPDGPFNQLIWQPLVQGGRLPEDYSIEYLSRVPECPMRPVYFRRLLELWQQRSDAMNTLDPRG